MCEIVGERMLRDFVTRSLMFLRNLKKPSIPSRPMTLHDEDCKKLHNDHVLQSLDKINSPRIDREMHQTNDRMLTTIKNLHSNIHDGNMRVVTASSASNSQSRTTKYKTLNMCNDETRAHHSNCFECCNAMAIHNVGSQSTNAPMPHMRKITEDRDAITDACKPSNGIEKSFSLVLCNWNKLNFDNTFIPGTPEFEQKEIWCKNKKLRQAFSKKKQIVVDTIDKLCKKDGSTRDHVARELDLLMDENGLSVSKMWKNWQETGDVVKSKNDEIDC